MKKLLLALMLLPGIAAAEIIPPGCYVADFYRTDACWVADDNFYEWTYYDRSTGVGYYGSAVEAIINLEGQSSSSFEAQRAAYDALSRNFNDAKKKNAALVAKLRRACGSKCRRIK